MGTHDLSTGPPWLPSGRRRVCQSAVRALHPLPPWCVTGAFTESDSTNTLTGQSPSFLTTVCPQ